MSGKNAIIMPKMLGATVQKSLVWATRSQVKVNLCFKANIDKRIVVNDKQNASRSQRMLLMYSKFTPTCFGKWLPSSGGRSYLRSYSSSVCIVGIDGS
jgi:hypothetical protein